MVDIVKTSLIEIKAAWDRGCHVDYHGGYGQLLLYIEVKRKGVGFCD